MRLRSVVAKARWKRPWSMVGIGCAVGSTINAGPCAVSSGLDLAGSQWRSVLVLLVLRRWGVVILLFLLFVGPLVLVRALQFLVLILVAVLLQELIHGLPAFGVHLGQVHDLGGAQFDHTQVLA